MLVRPREHLFHSHEQLQNVKRLDEIVLRTQPQPAHPALHVRLGGDENDRHALRAHVRQELEAVDFGQHDIAQRQIEGLILQQFQCLAAIRRANELIPGQAQVGFEQARNRRVVLDDENAFWHDYHPL